MQYMGVTDVRIYAPHYSLRDLFLNCLFVCAFQYLFSLQMMVFGLVGCWFAFCLFFVLFFCFRVTLLFSFYRVNASCLCYYV